MSDGLFHFSLYSRELNEKGCIILKMDLKGNICREVCLRPGLAVAKVEKKTCVDFSTTLASES